MRVERSGVHALVWAPDAETVLHVDLIAKTTTPLANDLGPVALVAEHGAASGRFLLVWRDRGSWRRGLLTPRGEELHVVERADLPDPGVDAILTTADGTLPHACGDVPDAPSSSARMA